ncbi:surfeit locus protein 6 [Chanos chanos]|uniref:Surfeit locus protein 6 n=1 Tax=Chanos chanos TaxID=29144 RepID=A0A6J2W4W9_CHACN|nr:surfeit locus protein 6 [Chanos chanos]
MASLAEKYDYLEKLTRKTCAAQNHDLRKTDNVQFRGTAGKAGALKKKEKNKQVAKMNRVSAKNGKARAKSIQRAAANTAKAQPGGILQCAANVKIQNDSTTEAQPKTGGGTLQAEFSAIDILRQRLHQKIEESRGQGPGKDSEEVRRRREKRKQERERKKRKKKEFLMKKLAEKTAEESTEEEKKCVPAPQPVPSADKPGKDKISLVFNKVEVGEEYKDKETKVKEKKKRRVKGSFTPLTGRNYKQLLTRMEQRKARVEELKEKDEGKAKREEEKMRWSNVLYKAEGLKIKDNEDLLRASLKRKEKRKEQRKKKWTQRSQQVVEKMQQRQDKRRRNIQKRKQNKLEKRKQKARKRGRVLPEDLKKVAM